MSYIDLTTEERETFLEMQVRGVRSPAWIREQRRQYPTSPNATKAAAALRALTESERAILEKFGPRWRLAA